MKPVPANSLYRRHARIAQVPDAQSRQRYLVANPGGDSFVVDAVHLANA